MQKINMNIQDPFEIFEIMSLNVIFNSDGITEIESVPWQDLKEHGVYSSGNHEDLEKFIAAHTGKNNPKVRFGK